MKLRGFRVTPTQYRTHSDIRFSARRRSDHSEGQRVWGMALDQAETVMTDWHKAILVLKKMQVSLSWRGLRYLSSPG